MTQKVHKQLQGSGSSKKLPSIVVMGGNLVKAVAKDVVNLRKRVDSEIYQKRINQCNVCDMRNGDRCTSPKCGCFISTKAWWESERCEEGKWDNIKI